MIGCSKSPGIPQEFERHADGGGHGLGRLRRDLALVGLVLGRERVLGLDLVAVEVLELDRLERGDLPAAMCGRCVYDGVASARVEA